MNKDFVDTKMNKNNYIERKIQEHSSDRLIAAGIVLIENEREVKTLEDLCIQFCCLTECKNCPIRLHNYEKRTEHEKQNLHDPCVSNLLKWVTEEALKSK